MLLEKLVVLSCESLGGVESLINHPAIMNHASKKWPQKIGLLSNFCLQTYMNNLAMKRLSVTHITLNTR